MKIGIYYLSSVLHNKEIILKQREEFLSSLNYEFEEVNKNEFNKYPLTLFLVETGGSEFIFKELMKEYKGPFYILTKGENNSFAASLEILRYIHLAKLKGEILHGSFTYINKRIGELINVDTLGVIGKPSDWLIASNVSYKEVLNKFNIELKDIDIDELVTLYNNDNNYYESDLSFDKDELNKANKVYQCLKKLKEKYNLKGLTLRCFDLLSSIKTTGCLGLSILNDNNITATCEGDIPTLISMHLLNRNLNLKSFQANPSRLNLDENNIIFAHCTLPLKMCDKFNLDTHFESGIGVAIHGELPLKDVTIFKISNDLKYYYVANGEIVENLYEKNLCRTQIKIKYKDDLSYYLNRSLANHHVIVLGDYKDEIIKMMSNYGLERVI